jgi:hypothetical protein
VNYIRMAASELYGLISRLGAKIERLPLRPDGRLSDEADRLSRAQLVAVQELAKRGVANESVGI